MNSMPDIEIDVSDDDVDVVFPLYDAFIDIANERGLSYAHGVLVGLMSVWQQMESQIETKQ